MSSPKRVKTYTMTKWSMVVDNGWSSNELHKPDMNIIYIKK